MTSFAVTAPDTDLGKVVVFDADGRLRRVLEVEGSSKLLLGIAFHPKTHDLLVIDFGAGKVLKVNPVNGKSSVFTSIGSGSGLNALAFDQAGNVYISDSFQGVVWRTGAQGGVATRWVDDALDEPVQPAVQTHRVVLDHEPRRFDASVPVVVEEEALHPYQAVKFDPLEQIRSLVAQARAGRQVRPISKRVGEKAGRFRR